MTAQTAAAPDTPAHGVTYAEAFRTWARVALLSFGGPAGQIAVMHRIIVEEKKWLGETRFLHGLNFCMLLPGPEAQQLAVYIGWLMHGVRGGLTAGILFVLPGFLAIMALSVIYAVYQEVALVNALFFGLKAAVLAIVVEAVLRIGRRALKSRVMVALAVAAFIGIFFLDLPFPLIVFGAGLIGYVGNRVRPDLFTGGGGHGGGTHKGPEIGLIDKVGDVGRAERGPARAIRIAATHLVLWFGPIVGLALVFGWDSIFVQQGEFFAKMAVVTFGGAYAVLAYVAQEAVQGFGWLTAREMLDGLAMAETTPGPLIMVLQFVGFMGAYRNPAPLDPLSAGLLASVVTTWTTFVPCFLWIFLFAPYLEALRENKALGAALAAITAAVVGVILNLAVWFALNVVFAKVGTVELGWLRLYVPSWSSLDWAALGLALLAMAAMFWWRLGMIVTLAGAAALGVAYYFVIT
ncbi:MAG: chromate efflux transporter [Alphaproteobacteria bacterium]|nr:chromate efflux transporter [Alphaproteobacteria bacterium]